MSVVAGILLFFWTLLLAAAVVLWRGVEVIYRTTISYGRFFNQYKYEIAISAAFFAGGLALIRFQDDTMLLIDVTYECGIFPTEQFIVSFGLFPAKTAYVFMTTRWNDVIIVSARPAPLS